MYERYEKDRLAKQLAGQIQGAGYAALGAAVEVPKQPEIQRELEALRERAEFVAEVVGDLIRRLEPITAPPTPEKAGQGSTQASFTPIGNSLAAITERLCQTQGRIMDVLARLEI